MNIWMTGKKSLKCHYLKNNIFYCHPNMEDITDANYMHKQKVCKDFKIKCQGEYHNLYVQSDTLLLGDVFEIFRNMSLEIYELDPDLTASGLAGKQGFKKVKSKASSNVRKM